MSMRSLLFAPANRYDLIGKFPGFDADIFALDLEDGTPPDQRPDARANLGSSVRKARGDRNANVYVRTNPAGSADFEDDLAAIGGSGADGVIVAKVDTPDDLSRLEKTTNVIAGIESIAGVLNVESIAALPCVTAVYFGAEDFATEMGARRSREGLEVLYARSKVLLAAKAAHVKALDQVVLDFRDEELFLADARFARGLGFDGKMCIHPAQIPLANEVFTPTEKEIEYAARLVSTYEKALAQGLATLDFEGRMVDGPLYKTSLAVLDAANRVRD